MCVEKKPLVMSTIHSSLGPAVWDSAVDPAEWDSADEVSVWLYENGHPPPP